MSVSACVGYFVAFWDTLYQKIWYVWMGRRLKDVSLTTRYIGRYAKRPAMSEARIKGYDGCTVTFEYEDKSEGVHRTTEVSVEQFIARLIRHIHDKHFRVIRYAGIFATRTRKRDMATARLLLKLACRRPARECGWRERRQRESGLDPLRCMICGSEMVLVAIVYRSRDGPLRERGR